MSEYKRHSNQCLDIGGGPGHDRCICWCHTTEGTTVTITKDQLVTAILTTDDPQPVSSRWHNRVFDALLVATGHAYATAAGPSEPASTGLDELRALSDAATPGPWERVIEGSFDQRHAAAKAFMSVMATRVEDCPDCEFSDMTYIRAGFPNVALVGNGPKQTENGDFIVACVNYVRARLSESVPPQDPER